MMIVLYFFAGIGVLATLAGIVVGSYAASIAWKMHVAQRIRERRYRQFNWQPARIEEEPYGTEHDSLSS